MTEHVQLEIIAAVVVIAGQGLTIWRAEMAAKRADIAATKASAANQAAVAANQAAVHVGVVTAAARVEQAAAIEQVHQAVNGGMAAQKLEILSLKEQLVVAKASDAEPVPVPTPTPVMIVNPDPIEVTPVNRRLDEIRGTQ